MTLTQNEININKEHEIVLYYDILNLIELNQDFGLKFLLPYRKLILENIEHFSSNLKPVSNRSLNPEKNDLIYNRNFYSIDTEDCDKLYSTIVARIALIERPSANLNPRIHTKSIDQCVHNILTNLTNKKRKTNWSQVLMQLLYFKDSTLKVLIANIKYTITKEFHLRYRKNRKNGKDIFYIYYTELAERIGTALLESFVFKHHIFYKLIFIYKKNGANNITVKEEKLLKNFLYAVVTKDTGEILLLLNNLIDIPNFQPCDLLVSLISNYIMVLLYKEYLKNNIPFISILKFFEESISQGLDFNCYVKELKTTIIQMGALVIEEGCSEKIDDTTNFFKTESMHEAFKKERKIVKIPEDMLNDLFVTGANNKPFLSRENIKHVQNVSFKEFNILNNIHDNKTKFIHPSPHIRLDIKDDSYLKENEPLVKLTVDKSSLLMVLREISWMFSFGFSDFFRCQVHFSSFYDLNLTNVTGSAEENAVLNLVVKYGLDFDESLDYVSEINNLMTALKENHFDSIYVKINSKIKNMINIIRNQKFFIKAMLCDCILFMPFKFIIQDTFLCTRGRIYNNTDFTNIQVFPLSKAFFKPFSNFQNDNEKEFNNVKRAVISLIKSTDIKLELHHMTFSDFKTKSYENNITYIKSHLIKENLVTPESVINYNNLISHINTIASQDQSFYPPEVSPPTEFSLLMDINYFIKNKNKTYYVYSLILNSKKNRRQQFMPNYYSLDATASGLQMSSMLLASEEMAKACNLIGNENIDIYRVTAEKFAQEYGNLLDFLDIFIIKYNFEDIIRKINIKNTKSIFLDYFDKTPTLETLFEDFILMDYASSTKDAEILMALYNNLNITYSFESYFNNINIDVKQYIWLLSKEELKYLTNPKINAPKDIIILLLVIKNIIIISKTFEKNNLERYNRFFTLRELFKDAIMTFYYNSTPYGRKDKFMEVIEDYLKENIILNEKEFFVDRTIMSSFFENYFSSYISNIIKDSDIFFKISDILCKRKKPVVFNNEFFTVTYDPKESETAFISTPMCNKKRGVQLVIKMFNDKFNKKEFDKGFIPNFIHFSDSTVCHKYIYFMQKLNQKLKHTTLFCATNHDNFYTNISPFLHPIVEDCYLDFLCKDPLLSSLLNFLDNATKNEIKDLLKNKPLNIKRLNPYFIK